MDKEKFEKAKEIEKKIDFLEGEKNKFLEIMGGTLIEEAEMSYNCNGRFSDEENENYRKKLYTLRDYIKNFFDYELISPYKKEFEEL